MANHAGEPVTIKNAVCIVSFVATAGGPNYE